MKKILLTGASGFIGSNIITKLSESFVVMAPSRQELDINNSESVDSFFNEHSIGAIIHSANISPAKNSIDNPKDMLEFTIRAFLNLERHVNKSCKMIYFGSGAEFDKRHDIKMIKEDSFGRSIPVEPYGFAKFILNKIARSSENIYNLRLFGCYGPRDAKTKFIRDAIDSCLLKVPITIRQNCFFDYMYVEDLADIVSWFINHCPDYHDYNVCCGQPIDLLSIAQIIAKQMHNNTNIIIKKIGLNLEYTASNARLAYEIPELCFTSLVDGIRKQIEWQKGVNIK